MILKKLKRRVFNKPKATMIGELLDYILQRQDENGNDKLAYHGVKNFIAGTAKGQKAEMINLAAESVRSPMPVTHWCLSWQENEQPSHEQIDEAVDIFLQRMGLEGHQVVYAQHKNTGHCHVHIVVNRTHPDTLKVIQPHRGFDIEAAHRIVAELAHKQGWAAENRARYRVSQEGEIVRNTGKVQLSVNPSSAAADFESATGEKSAQRIAQEKGYAVINTAKSWAELHTGLQGVGLRFEKKGSGAIVFVGETAVKASSINRNFGLSKLCKRLGDYEPGDYAPDMKPPEPEPVSTIAQDEWREYRALKKQEAEERQEERKRRGAVIAQARIAQRAHRRTALTALAGHGLSMLNIGRHFLKVQQRKELQQLREEQPKRKKPLPRFTTWLVERNSRARLLWRYRRRIKYGTDVKQFGRPLEFPKIGDMVSPYRSYREVLLQKPQEKIDPSRLDAMIALWMRVTGYTREDVFNEITHKAYPSRKEQEHRDWKRYAYRTLGYAFGPAGDIDIAAFGPTPEKILAFHQEAEKLETARMGTVEVEWEAPRMRMMR